MFCIPRRNFNTVEKFTTIEFYSSRIKLLFAAINAFNEELYFRATLLSTLSQVIGKNNALLINVVFFGMAHYLYGSPPGIIGFMMTGFLVFLLGRSMIETKGFLWPWVIHFMPDLVIFFSYAIIWIR